MTQLIDLGKLRFHFAGEWNSATTYESNDIVKYGGNVYVYTHALKTAGNLPTDTDHWALMVEGFKFSGVFSTSTNYHIGDGVAHGGKVYVCIKDCTNQTPPNTTFWSQFADGIQYEGTYSNTKGYQKNDVVTLGGSAYIAKVDTTGNNPTDATYWDKFVEGVSAQSVYNNGTAYNVGDLVAYGSNIYRCSQNTTGHIPTNATYWTPFMYGFANKGVWSSGASYKIGEYVTYGGSLYQALADNSNANPSTSTANWSKVTYGFRAVGEWGAATQYITDDVVSYGGNTYIALLPHASTVFATDLAANKWQKFNGGIRYRGVWDVEATYLKDDVVQSGTSTYICIASTVVGGVAPFLGPNAGFQMFAAGAEGFIARSGDQMEGALLVRSNPSLYNEVINKGYVDDFKNIWSNITSAVRLYGGIIENNGDGTVRVAAGGGLWKKEASSVEGVPSGECEPMQLNTAQGGKVFFNTWNAVQNVELTNNAYNYLFVVWDHTIDNGDGTFGNTKVIASTNFYLQDWQNDPAYASFKAAHPELTNLPSRRGAMLHAFTIGRVYKMDNEITIRVCGTNGWNFNKRVQLFGEEFFPVIRARGLDIQPIAGTLQFNVTEGVMWAEMVNRFTVQAFRMDHGDTFTAWYQHTAEEYAGNLAAIQAEYPTGIPNRKYDILHSVADSKYYRYQNGAWSEVLDYVQSKVNVSDTFADLAALQATHPTGYMNNPAVHDYVLLQLQASDAFYKYDGTRSAGDRWVLYTGSRSNYIVMHFIGNVESMNATHPNGFTNVVNAIVPTADGKYYEYSGVAGSAGWRHVQGYVNRNGWMRFYNQSAVDPNRYNDAQNDRLLDIPSGKYGVAWIYMVHDNSCHVVYGQGSYTSEEAKQAALPAPLPGLLSAYSTLVGKMTFAHGGTAFENAESPFLEKFISSGVALHNDLAGLDGGSSQQSKYYHLDEQKYNFVGNLYANGDAIIGSTAEAFSTTQNINIPFRASLVNGGANVDWSATGLPSGATITASGMTAVVSSSSPVSAGTYNIVIKVASGSLLISKAVSLVVAAEIPLFTYAIPYSVQPSTSVTLNLAKATAASGTVTHTLLSGSLPSWATLNSNGTITGTTPAQSTTPVTYTFTVRATNGSYTRDKTITWDHVYYAVQGQARYASVGTYSWVAPVGVTEVSVVAIGGGGGGSTQWANPAGGGGGLGWKNNIQVTPGKSYTVVVGAGGSPASNTTNNSSSMGKNSYFIDTSTVCGFGAGQGGSGSNSQGANSGQAYYGGGFTGDGGGRGGDAASYQGGGGAGGYSGYGGYGNTYNGAQSGSGAANGGYYYSSTYGTGGGGGVELYGQGSTGYRFFSPWSGYSSNYGGGEGGSGGSNGGYGETPWSSSSSYNYGGTFGGGCSGPGTSYGGGSGGQGGLRIIWGPGRAFPSTNTSDVTTQSL